MKMARQGWRRGVPGILLALEMLVPPLAAQGQDFLDSGQHLGNADSQCVALGDFDQDGDLDAFVANQGSPSRVWVNAGSGFFRDSGQHYPEAACVGVSDLDQDGDLDAFLSAGQSVVLLNGGLGLFTHLHPLLDAPGSAGLAIGDLDSDGDDDVVVSRWGHPLGLTTKVWMNNGSGLLSQGDGPSSVEVSTDVSLADVDGDGYLDLVVANQADSLHLPIADELWLNDGSGRFPGPARRFGEACTYEIAVGDLNSDGRPDLFAVNSSHAGQSDPANRVYLNEGDGAFQDSGQSLGDSYSLSAALGDLDSDGDLDAFVGNWGLDKIWINDGEGMFSEAPVILGSEVGLGVALGDLDGDGDLDVFVANAKWQGAEAPNRVWLNQAMNFR